MEEAQFAASGNLRLIYGELKSDVQTLVGFTVSIQAHSTSQGCLLDLLVCVKPLFFPQVSVCVCTYVIYR